ncbi:NAD(P)-dependent oxidoreductase [Microlunatus endophyticus]|uniref:NAD(P)-dependent oxidoreductase n=1 Tax=Microlunatus endophyticus TaxID=1716077 RepID=A0A917S8U3_9ACTN|nr:SDR family oxidoreductase [Microlunatus endophyticus]GGL61842.1 NAD(P)-dependent oxidoreductase [Microlunatus endophyticus]
MSRSQHGLVLVTGATGYVGGRLIPELLAAGFRVRALTRRPQALSDRSWSDQIEIVDGDADSHDDLLRALADVDVAYYLIHSMRSGPHFESMDRRVALGFADAAKKSGVRRIVYLGGMHPLDGELSPHLESRREVGEIFLQSGVGSIVLKAAVIIGSGSASFEMMRYLTERLPVMVAPTWINTKIQPIAIRDVLRYLVGAAGLPGQINRAFDIGGPDVLTYREMIQRYAAVVGLPSRLIRATPALTPWLASHWVGLVTPVPAGIAKPLVLSLTHEVTAKEHDLEALIPSPEGLIGFDRAVELALQKIRDYDVSTTWTSASYGEAPSDPLPDDPDWAGGDLYVDDRCTVVDATPEMLWRVIEEIGGKQGWHSWRLGWSTRGVLDRIAGGPGLRRGRRDPLSLQTGDALDWWRVEKIVHGSLLRLRAEMRLPGRAWLELISETDDQGRAVFRQRAIFHPQGLLGHLYWRSIVPFHGIVFGGMQRNISELARRGAAPDRQVVDH